MDCGSLMTYEEKISDREAHQIIQNWFENAVQMGNFEDANHYLINEELARFQLTLEDWDLYISTHPKFLDYIKQMIQTHRGVL